MIQDLLKATLDALPDGVLLVDGNREVVYCNATFAQMWNIPAALIEKRQSKELVGYVLDAVEDGGVFAKQVEQIYTTHEPSRDEVRLKDGRVFLRRSVHFGDIDRWNTRIWIFSDITQVKALQKCSLTGLYTRKQFDDEFARLMAEQMTEQGPAGHRALAILDIDNFKCYNDLYGHAAGDRVISAVGSQIKAALNRDSDRGYRIGGEEFLIVCSGREAQDLNNHVDGIRSGVEKLALAHERNATYGKVTVSVGLGLFVGTREPSEAFELVDKALYRSKDGGRNRTTVIDL